MNAKFESLPEEKKMKIINAAIEEFAKNGYKRGSTNNIVKNAEISKGLLFHYFESKKNLFIYLFENVIEFFIPIIKEQIEKKKPSDIFERYKVWSVIKFKIFSKYPLRYEFLLKALASTPEEIEEEIQKRYIKMYRENIGMILEDIDKSRFKDNINFNKAVEVLTIFTDGLVKKYFQHYKGKEEEMLKDIDTILKDIDEYIEILKWGVYKK